MVMLSSGKLAADLRLLITFFITNLFLSTFFLDFWTSNSNTTSRVLPVVAYLEQGHVCIDKYEKRTIDKVFVDEHYYSDKAPLPSWLMIPFAKVFEAIGWIDFHSETEDWLPLYLLGAFLFGSVPFSLIVLLSFIAVRRNSTGNISPVLLSMLPFYASFIFVFSGTFFGHIFSGSLLLGAYIYIKRKNHLAAGFFAGLAFLSEYALAIFVALWGLQLWMKDKNIKASFLLVFGFIPSLIAIFIYNYTITGSPFDMLYKYHLFENMEESYGFTGPSVKSLFGLSFSPYRGMFIYAPFLFFLLYAFIKKKPDLEIKKLVSSYLVLPCVVFFLFMASYSYWDGGWSYGPRFLTGITILMIYEGLIYLSQIQVNKQLFWITISFGLVCAFMAKATVVYSVPDGIMNPISDSILSSFLRGDLNQNNLLTRTWGVYPLYAFVIFCGLFSCSVFCLYRWNKKSGLKDSE